jgi:uncharacterized membrane protein YdjX (TVP38/TMEM64 family)
MKSPRLWITLGLATLIGALLFFLPIREWTQVFLDWVEAAGAWGPVLLALAYIPATLLFIPGTLLTLGAGFAYELLLGTAIVSAGSVLGSSAAFVLGRTLMRDWVGRQIAARPRLRAIDEAIAKDGFKVTLLIRLSPAFPYNLMGYVFGVTRVSFRDHFFASWIGMLPGTILYVYLGCAARQLADPDMADQGPHPAFFVGGLLLTAAVTIYITAFARRAIRAAVPDSLPPEGAA